MTTDGNYLGTNLNTIHIPTINTVMSPVVVPTPIGFTFPTIGLYYNSKKFYAVSPSSNIVYSSNLSDPLNLVPHKNAQVGAQSEFINNIYPTSIDNYFYSYGVKTDLGGVSAGTIFRAHINSPVSWADTGATLPASIGDSALYVNASNIYVIGGINSVGTTVNTIYVASRSTPTTFVASGNTLPAVRVFSMITTVGSTIYLYGGSADGTTSESTIYSANIADPTTWTNLGALMPQAIHAGAIYVDSAYVWLFGGTNSATGMLNTIYRATLASPTSFSSVGTLPYAIDANKVFVSGTNLYMIGATLNGSGMMKASLSNLISWTSINISVLPTEQSGTHLILDASNLYLLGGRNSAGTTSTVIQTASLTTPLEVTNSVATLPVALVGGEVIKTTGYYYIIGGNGITGNDYRATLAAPTTWAAALSTGPTRTYGKAVIVDEQLWYLGGETAAGTPVITGSRAIIQNGIIVDWMNNPGTGYLKFELPIALSRFSLIQAGDFIYILGGYTTGSLMNSNIYRIQKNRLAGSSGFTTWVNVGLIDNPMVESSVAIINNMAYIIGGGPNTSFNTSDNFVLSASMTDLANGIASFREENTATFSKAGAAATCINNVLYLYGGRLTTNGSTDISRNMGYATHTLISPLVAESTTSLPTIDLKTGSLGSYSAFQRLGMLPWLISKA